MGEPIRSTKEPKTQLVDLFIGQSYLLLSRATRKLRFDPAIFEERFRTIERIFAWEDKFRRLLLRFERLSPVHYAFKTLAYTMINLRHYR